MTNVSRLPISTRPIPRRPENEPGEDLDQLAARMALVFLEVEVGRRPLPQLREILSPALYRRVGRACQGRTRNPATSNRLTVDAVRSVFSHRLSGDAFEASVIIDRGHRVTALALRLERHQGRWRVVELTAPEDGDRPRRTASLPQEDEDLPPPSL